MAEGGTIFLDDIDDVPASVQVKLLRVMQQRIVERVGGTRSIPVDVRVITGSKRSLKQLVAEGKFREDLYYRLNVVPIWLPPLRERREDIPLLQLHLLARHPVALIKDVALVLPKAFLRLPLPLLCVPDVFQQPMRLFVHRLQFDDPLEVLVAQSLQVMV